MEHAYHLQWFAGQRKSTIARALAQRLGAVYLRIDTIEQAIRAAEQADNEMGPYRLFRRLWAGQKNLALGSIVITDSVNPIQLTGMPTTRSPARSGCPVSMLR